MKMFHRWMAAVTILCAAAARSEQVLLSAGTPLTIEDGMRLQNRSVWIRQRLGEFILPNVSVENVSLQDCLEFLRLKTSLALSKAAETDRHIHFLRCGPGQQDVRVTLKLTDTSILAVCEELAKHIGARLDIVDYGVLFEVPLATRPDKGEISGNPWGQATLKDLIQQGFGDGARKASEAMEAHLKKWNPVGCSALELKGIFGPPSVEKASSITYLFDTGSFGWGFEFVLQDGKVVELKRPASE